MGRNLSTKKRINIGQAFGLFFLLFLSYYELTPLSESDTFFFPSLFLFSLFYIGHHRRMLPLAWHNALMNWLHPIVVRIRAFHIWQIRGIVPPVLNDKPCTCKNCRETFTGNFCPRCGQSRYTPRYVLKGIVGNVLRTIFRVDGKFAHTLLELLYRPGHMMRDFIQGRRINYTLPLAMVFLMTEQEKAETDDPIEQKSLGITIRSMEKALAEVQRQDSIAGTSQSDNELDDILSIPFLKKAEAAIESIPFLSNVWSLMRKWGHGNKAFHILLTLPLLAIATRWAFYRRKKPDTFNLMEHIFIQAYIATQILLISTLVVPFNGTAHVDDLYEVPFWFIFLLFCWDYRQLYLCTWWRSFWKTLLMFTYCLLIIIVLATVGVLLLCLAEGTTNLSL